MKPKPAGRFGVRLARARRRAALTQASLARALGVAENTVARWERGEHTPHPVMAKAVLERFAALKGKG